MTRSPHPRRLAASGLALAVLALTAACNQQQDGQTTQGTSGTGSAPTSTEGDATVETNSYSVPDPVKTIKLDNRAGAVTVTAADGPISVTETLRFNGDKPGTSHQVTADTLSLVNSGCPNQPPVNARCEVAWDIKAPAGTNLDLDGKAGGITVTGFAGTLDAETSAGGIKGRQLTSKSVTAEAKAGGVDLTFTAPPDQVKASGSAGSIDIRVPAGTSYAVRAESSTGEPDINVAQDNGSRHKIEAKTSAGSIDITTSE